MSYDFNIAPRTLEEWNALVDERTSESQAQHEAAIAQATQQYALLPESADKPSLEQYLAPIEPAKDHAYWETYYRVYYPQEIFDVGSSTPTTAQLFAQLRSIREVKLQEYDAKISQLNRLIREHPDYAAYPIERAQWDTYATALCNLPSQDGAPWDGGGSLTPWPAKPE